MRTQNSDHPMIRLHAFRDCKRLSSSRSARCGYRRCRHHGATSNPAAQRAGGFRSGAGIETAASQSVWRFGAAFCRERTDLVSRSETTT